MLRLSLFSFYILALSSIVYAKPSYHAALQDIRLHARQQDGDNNHSVLLLADLATDGDVTPAGEIIRNILQTTTPATVDNSVVYTRPDAVSKSGQGGLDNAACRKDTCCVWSYIVPIMVTAFSEDGGTRCSALARSAIRMGFHDAGA